jgi:hypothetical protein
MFLSPSKTTLTGTTFQGDECKVDVSMLQIRRGSVNGRLNEFVRVGHIAVVFQEALVGGQWTTWAIDEEL